MGEASSERRLPCWPLGTQMGPLRSVYTSPSPSYAAGIQKPRIRSAHVKEPCMDAGSLLTHTCSALQARKDAGPRARATDTEDKPTLSKTTRAPPSARRTGSRSRAARSFHVYTTPHPAPEMGSISCISRGGSGGCYGKVTRPGSAG